MSRFLIALFVASLFAVVVPSPAQAGPLRNGAKAAGRGVVKVLKRVVRPLRGLRGC